MISFVHVGPVLSTYKLECDECHRSTELQINHRQAEAIGGVDAALAQQEPYERAALSRLGCPHAVPAPEAPEAPAAEPRDGHE